ncbi:MAG: right-handed parallel beta-helix repeat-containing protein [Neisseria sp.]|nr:right-handed parallel beta-helix repeat-containing protein [Neisseria sp.]
MVKKIITPIKNTDNNIAAHPPNLPNILVQEGDLTAAFMPDAREAQEADELFLLPEADNEWLLDLQAEDIFWNPDWQSAAYAAGPNGSQSAWQPQMLSDTSPESLPAPSLLAAEVATPSPLSASMPLKMLGGLLAGAGLTGLLAGAGGSSSDDASSAPTQAPRPPAAAEKPATAVSPQPAATADNAADQQPSTPSAAVEQPTASEATGTASAANGNPRPSENIVEPKPAPDSIKDTATPVANTQPQPSETVIAPVPDVAKEPAAQPEQADKHRNTLPSDQPQPTETIQPQPPVTVTAPVPAKTTGNVAQPEVTEQPKNTRPSTAAPATTDKVTQPSETAITPAPGKNTATAERPAVSNATDNTAAETAPAASDKTTPPSETDAPPSPGANTPVADAPAVVGKARLDGFGEYTIYRHAEYGKYVDARDFGSDPSGKSDSLAAIKAALAAAHQQNAAVYLHGKLTISDQIVFDESNARARGLFGDGMGETVVSFGKAQTGVYNPNTNQDDIREYAGILIDGQNHKTIANLSVEYTNSADFYRRGESYFGKVTGILVNDADHTLISKVEVSGANRAGVFFTSTQTLQKDPQSSDGRSYKARLIRDEIQEDYADLPLGENNRIVDSYLHHNRVAGALVSYQKDFIAENNLFSWNGHAADGGTGYGIAASAGSYNFGLTYRNNTSDHNYRKGFDVHDGNNVVIENNTSIGDRLYGIAVYNRQFTMDNVKISNNTIIQDPAFRLKTDDNGEILYHGYAGIQLQTNTQFKDLHSSGSGSFDISGNTIKNLAVYQDALHTYGIEFRNHEQQMDYTLNIADNTISGESSKYLIAIINNTQDQINQTAGPGSGTINITGNSGDIGAIASGTMPIFINEHHTDGNLRGEVTLADNIIRVREHSDGSVEGVQVIGNAERYNVVNNIFELGGQMNHSIISIHGRGSGEVPLLNVYNNEVRTDLDTLYRRWVEYVNAEVSADGNYHKGSALAAINPLPLSAVASITSVSPKLRAAANDSGDEALPQLSDLLSDNADLSAAPSVGTGAAVGYAVTVDTGKLDWPSEAALALLV